jgi:hypothetical protein
MDTPATAFGISLCPHVLGDSEITMSRTLQGVAPSVFVFLVLILILWVVPLMPAQNPAASPPATQQSTVYLCPLHPGVQSKQPGRCPKCNTTLVASEAAGPGKAYFACPMHPDVQALTPGKCSRCGMSLVEMNPPEIGKYRLRLVTTPLIPGERVRMSFQISHPKTKQQVRDFNIVHDMPFHLFLVSEDMAEFQHLHPTQQPDGSFVVETVFKKAGVYHTFSEIFPVGGTPQDFHSTLTMTRLNALPTLAGLVPDKALTKVVDGVRFELQVDPAALLTNKAAILKYRLVDERTRLPIRDLQPYLGAWGHTFILHEQATVNIHAHPTEMIPEGVDRSTLRGSSEVSFETVFKFPGRYRIWSQFQRLGKVTTVSFTVKVSPLSRIASWDGRSWSALDGSSVNGPNGSISAIAAVGSDVYVGGDFTEVGGMSANRIAKWDGRNWSALGGGVNGAVRALAVSGSNVYIGGDFTEAGGVSANRIAKWDGRNWSALGEGVTGCKDAYCTPAVHAIAVSGKDVYVGGRFTTAGHVLADGIARWDGSSWSAVGGGMRVGIYDGVVWALAVSGSDLYAGGQFITSGDENIHNIAKWNGHRWSALESGIKGGLERASAIAVNGNDVYIGGDFTEAGLVSANRIAKWDGHHWSALGDGVNGAVRALAVSANDVYIGGDFTYSGGVSASRIAKWDGRHWSALGGGVSSIVNAIGVSGKNVYCQDKE